MFVVYVNDVDVYIVNAKNETEAINIVYENEVKSSNDHIKKGYAKTYKFDMSAFSIDSLLDGKKYACLT